MSCVLLNVTNTIGPKASSGLSLTSKKRRGSCGGSSITPTLRENALRLLMGTQKTRRPRRRKGLIAVLHSHFMRKVPESELQDLVGELIAQGQLSDNNGAITYHF